MAAFLKALATAAVPPPGEFEGRGIVMSGGPMHVMQAVANLRVVRAMHGSSLRAEFWHAFELSPVHCRVLLEAGAECRAIRLPGVYVAFQTFVPTIMLSSFRHVIWLDTDATLLHPPERLLESQAYGDTGALFWPAVGAAGQRHLAPPGHRLRPSGPGVLA
ncbi:unnamed protein product [Polarella glacialis]|uniref:Uncharacterized protein n=1 Tax=Polarella glacialis TaxID=89957 RepID=A0A813FDS4_POLGL|nr:unnamed protein product [Polarella glacialis]